MTVTVTRTINEISVTHNATPVTVAPTYTTVNVVANTNNDIITESRRLAGWAEAEAYEETSRTPHGTYTQLVSTATVKWPDGSAGTLTVTAYDATWEALESWTITHTDSGLTATQAAITRNSGGFITTKPAITVA